MMPVPADIELPAPPEKSERLDDLDDEALDQLPYGVVGLDVEGRITRYNLAEARLARLDRQAVLGEMFFVKVAPCTATDAFQGRVQRFLESGAASDAFPYFFDFRFGGQEVQIELTRGGQQAAVYFLINRKRFLPVRPADVGRTPAISLAELRPDEQERGVKRPARTGDGAISMQRQAVLPAAFFGALKSTWDRVAPEGGPVFSLAWGESWGRLAMIELDTLCVEQQGRGLRELPTREALSLIADHFAEQGLGRIIVDFAQSKVGVVIVHLDRSLLAEATRAIGGRTSPTRCALVAGYLQAVFSHLGNKKLHVREGCCAAQGHERCSFFVVGDVRRSRLLELVHKKNINDFSNSDDVVRCLVAE